MKLGEVWNEDGKTYQAVECYKCAGSRVFNCWRHIAGGTCFTCGGTGIVAVRHYTPEQAAKRAAAAAKRAAKKEAQMAPQREAQEKAQAARAAAQATRDAEREAAKALSSYVGVERERLTLDVECVACFDFGGFRGSCGYGYVLKSGADKLVYFASAAMIPFEPGNWKTARGWQGTLTATVKKHQERDGEKQTVITRAKVQ